MEDILKLPKLTGMAYYTEMLNFVTRKTVIIGDNTFVTLINRSMEK